MNVYRVVTLHGLDAEAAPYRNLIYTSYLKSLRFGNDWFKDIESDRYYQVYHSIIEGLLARPTTELRIALLNEDQDICLGWSLCEETTLHYVFVKGDIDARYHGIGRDLIPTPIHKITHLTRIGRELWKKKLPGAVFDPFF